MRARLAADSLIQAQLQNRPVSAFDVQHREAACTKPTTLRTQLELRSWLRLVAWLADPMYFPVQQGEILGVRPAQLDGELALVQISPRLDKLVLGARKCKVADRALRSRENKAAIGDLADLVAAPRREAIFHRGFVAIAGAAVDDQRGPMERGQGADRDAVLRHVADFVDAPPGGDGLLESPPHEVACTLQVEAKDGGDAEHGDAGDDQLAASGLGEDVAGLANRDRGAGRQRGGRAWGRGRRPQSQTNGLRAA